MHACVSVGEDLSGLEPSDDDWFERDALPETFKALLTEVGRTYVPVLLANAVAVDDGVDIMTTEVDGSVWEQTPFPYQAKCLQWIRQEFARLDPEDRDVVGDILAGTGCERLF